MSQQDTAWVVTELSITGFITKKEAESYIKRNGGVLFTDREEAEDEYYSLRDPRNFFWEP